MIRELLDGSINQNEYLSCNDITLVYEKLPKRVYGFVFLHNEDTIVVINDYLSNYKKKKTILHEFAHIELNHLYNKKRLLEFKIESIEDEADKYISDIESEMKEVIK